MQDMNSTTSWCLGFLISLKNNSIVLLKKTKSLHIGMWNGLGGKVEYNETNREAMIRECKEESKLDNIAWIYVGWLEGKSPKAGEKYLRGWNVGIFTADIEEAKLDQALIPHFWEIQDIKNVGDEPYEVPLVDLPRMELAPHTGAIIYACLEKLRNNNTPIIQIRELQY